MSIVSSIHRLPDEMLVNVFSHLSAKVLCKICPVSKKWNAAASVDQLWKKIFDNVCANENKPENISFKSYILQFNYHQDFIFIIDKSGSMLETDENNKSRWDIVAESTNVVVSRLLKRLHLFNRSQGIDLYFFSSYYLKIRAYSPKNVNKIFNKVRPQGSTNVNLVLKHVFKWNFGENANGRQKTIVLITDGTLDDPDSTLRIIRRNLNELNSEYNHKITFLLVCDDVLALHYFNDMSNDFDSKFLEVLDADELGSLSKALLKTVTLPEITDPKVTNIPVSDIES